MDDKIKELENAIANAQNEKTAEEKRLRPIVECVVNDQRADINQEIEFKEIQLGCDFNGFITPLTAAVRYKWADLLPGILTLERGTNILKCHKVTNVWGANIKRTALDYAMGKPEALKKLIKYAHDTQINVPLLLREGAENILSRAIVMGCSESVRVLLAEGAPVNKQGTNHEIPLHTVMHDCFFYKSVDREETARLLYSYGACPLIKNNTKKTPCDMAKDELETATDIATHCQYCREQKEMTKTVGQSMQCTATIEKEARLNIEHFQHMVQLLTKLEHHHTVAACALQEMYNQPLQQHLRKQSFLYWLPKELQELLMQYVACQYCGNISLTKKEIV